MSVPSFAARCENQIFDDEKGCKVARCDGVKMQYLPFQIT